MAKKRRCDARKALSSSHLGRHFEGTAHFPGVRRDTISYAKTPSTTVMDLQWSRQLLEEDPYSRFPTLSCNRKSGSFAAAVHFSHLCTHCFRSVWSQQLRLAARRCAESSKCRCSSLRETQHHLQYSPALLWVTLVASASLRLKKKILSHVQTQIFPRVTCQLSAENNAVS